MDSDLDLFVDDVARQRAEELRLDPEDIDGGGPEGRISVADVERCAPPPPPDSLGDEGSALWEDLVRYLPARLEFDPRERRAILEACRQADEIALLTEALSKSGHIVRGAAGQTRVNGLVAELRQARLAIVKLLGAVGLHGDAGEEVYSAASERGRRAAEKRWGRKEQLALVGGHGG